MIQNCDSFHLRVLCGQHESVPWHPWTAGSYPVVEVIREIVEQAEAAPQQLTGG
jgi:hypothetical protein